MRGRWQCTRFVTVFRILVIFDFNQRQNRTSPLRESAMGMITNCLQFHLFLASVYIEGWMASILPCCSQRKCAVSALIAAPATRKSLNKFLPWWGVEPLILDLWQCIWPLKRRGTICVWLSTRYDQKLEFYILHSYCFKVFNSFLADFWIFRFPTAFHAHDDTAVADW